MPNPPQQDAIRVFLLGDHAVIRSALRLLVESQRGLRVIGEASCPDALQAVRLQPDVLVADCEPEVEEHAGLLSRLLAAAPGLRILILTSERNPEFHTRLLRAGAAGVLRKDESAEKLLKAIQKVHQGEIWLDRATVSRVLDQALRRPGNLEADDHSPAKLLTQREREIVSLVGEALNNKQIARRLFISQATVRHHLTSIFGKLGVSNRLELLRFAFRHGLARDALSVGGGTPAREPSLLRNRLAPRQNREELA